MAMDLWFEWDENNEERSFDDSDRFDEDSLCSWMSEPESLTMNWRGWKKTSQNGGSSDFGCEEVVESLVEICARTVAKTVPFELVERMYPQIPEQMQVRIAFWSFPEGEGDIRVYSCLANGSADEFSRGEHLLKGKAVKDALQIGFHLSATVHQPHTACQTKGLFNVAITFDRGKITSCNCTCNQSATWCAHIIALCLFRIHYPQLVCLRAPVSEYLSRLRRDQLQKFAQYLISELPQQILPTAQRILDELLSLQESDINTVSGAPDPTAGPAVTDLTRWYLDEAALHDNVKKMLVKFCGPGPLVFTDVNAIYYSNTAPPTAAEWSNLLRPLRSRQPEGMWNLLSIVRELFHRRDGNAVNLLVILTEECLSNDQVVIWWFDSRSQASDSTALHNNGNRANPNATNTAEATKHACAGFCDELVVLWRLAALSPHLIQEERDEMRAQLKIWHQKALEKARAGHGSNDSFTVAISCFSGFYPAIEACSLDWCCIDLEVNSTCKADPDQDDTEGVASELPPIQNLGFSESANNKNAEGSLSRDDRLQDGIKTNGSSDGDVSQEQIQNLLHRVDEDTELLCARAEALHVHGYTSKARELVILLAEKILNQNSRLDININATENIDASSGPTSFTSTTLVKAAFLCGVLAEDPLCQHLAFRVGMFGLEMPRRPARSKALEVKLANQETELVMLLKKLPLGEEELIIVREKAEQLSQGKLMRGDAVLPLMLAAFLFETLCIPSTLTHGTGTKLTELNKEDEELGFKAGLFALGMRANVLETQYPILCEGTRRQRGDLALALLLYCRDDSARLRQVMDVLLDKSRYDTPSFIKERTKHTPGKHDKANESESPKHEEDTGTLGKTCGGSGTPLRRASTRSSSTTSDSGTDSSSSGCGRTRYHGSFQSASGSSRITVTLTEMPQDDASGSSSGVDTDSATLEVAEPNHPSRELSITVTDVSSNQILKPLGLAASLSKQSSDELVSTSSLSSNSNHAVHLSANQRRSSDPGSSDIEIDIEETPGDVSSASVPRDSQEGSLRLSGKVKEEAKAGNSSVSSLSDYDPGVVVCSSDDRFHEVFTPEDMEEKNVNKDVLILTNEASTNVVPTTVGEPAEGVVSEDVEIPQIKLVEGNQAELLITKEKTAVAENNLSGEDEQNLVVAGIEEESGLAVVEGEEVAIDENLEENVAVVDVAAASHEPAADHKPARNRRRRARGKGKRRRNKTAVNYATEAEAHFMFELAKTVLDKGGGSSSPSVFSQAVRTVSNLGPNRSLQLCAFETGLFALGLHNRTSPNWLSRTYSSHVSWISGQAMEIGSTAVQLLLKHWDGNLTPSEVASIADRASRSNDPNMVKSAAELALSCLHMAHTLNPGEILRALTQCREEDTQLLDSGCQAVESAARGGGVYPEVLFEVARHWAYLHEQSQTSSSSRAHKNESRSRASQSRSSLSVQPQSSSVSSLLQQSAFSSPPSYSGVPPPPYTTPEQYVQQQMHHQVQQMMGHYKSHLQYLPYRSSNQPIYNYPYCRSSTNFSCSGFSNLPPHFQSTGAGPSGSQHASRTNTAPQNSQVSYYLNNAYRVGMLALESLSRRTPDDRPNVKFARSPTCSDDIRWLCSLSAWLGMSHLQRFCVAALNAVQSPFVLHDLALDSGRHLARSNPAQLAPNLRSPSISPLVQKSLSMYAQCIHYHLVNINASEYEDFVELLRHARGAFCMTPGGMTQFNELLQSIRRGYPKKKELWQMIMTGLAKA